ncbi:MAG TPA: HAMP domain-containing sensor histidine kinase [Vicinamibacterales bacterium]
MLSTPNMLNTGFAGTIANRLAEEHASLAARWFARLRVLVPVSDNEVFPSDSLLDHIPSLIIDISDYVRTPETEAIVANTRVFEKARELGTLRHQQQASLHQVLREYQLLGEILTQFVQAEVADAPSTPGATESIKVVMRIQQAVSLLLQETVETFVGLYTRTITDQAERLEQFTRMAAHEWRQPLGTLQTAAAVLRLPGVSAEQRDNSVAMIDRNVRRLIDMTMTLERIARIDSQDDSAMRQRVELTVVAREAARQLREMAQAGGVTVNVADDMPIVHVDVGRLELTLVNLLSNAIKYSDPNKPVRVVEVSGRMVTDEQCVIEVRDNGLGIPTDRIPDIFRRFTRAHDRSGHVPGVGLGLSIVADCVEEMSGRVDVESVVGQGSVFRVRIPAA